MDTEQYKRIALSYAQAYEREEVIYRIKPFSAPYPQVIHLFQQPDGWWWWRFGGIDNDEFTLSSLNGPYASYIEAYDSGTDVVVSMYGIDTTMIGLTRTKDQENERIGSNPL